VLGMLIEVLGLNRVSPRRSVARHTYVALISAACIGSGWSALVSVLGWPSHRAFRILMALRPMRLPSTTFVQDALRGCSSL
jgi:hypothetical protein